MRPGSFQTTPGKVESQNRIEGGRSPDCRARLIFFNAETTLASAQWFQNRKWPGRAIYTYVYAQRLATDFPGWTDKSLSRRLAYGLWRCPGPPQPHLFLPSKNRQGKEVLLGSRQHRHFTICLLDLIFLEEQMPTANWPFYSDPSRDIERIYRFS